MSLEAFTRLANELVFFEASLDAHAAPMSSIHSIDVHREELASIWRDVKISYDKCLADIEAELEVAEGDGKNKGDKESGESELDNLRHKYTSAYITYCRCSTHLRERAHAISASTTTPKVDLTTRSDSGQGFGFTLPPCEIPIFCGDYSSWPTFRDIFEAVCIKNPRLSSVEKLFHLSQKTKGEAHDIVKKVPLTNENFRVAWANLCSRYENKRALINIQLKKLFGLSPISNETATALKVLQRDINSCISLLELYEIDVGGWDPIFVFVCSNCLPNSTLTLWEQTLPDKTVIPKWEKMDNFLTDRHRTLESVSEVRKSIAGSSTASKATTKTDYRYGNKSNGTHVHTFQNKVEPNCPLCPKETHLLRKCPRFLKMSPSERLAEIKKDKLCTNCFSRVHSVKNCKSKYSCFKCNKKHNTLLHREESKLSDSPSGSNSTPSQVPSSSIQSTNTSGEGVVHTCFSTSSRDVLLGTALVNISYNGLMICARALVDSGSQGTFISKKLFNSMRLPFRKTYATVSGLNNSVSASVQKECSFTLSPAVDNGIEFSATALVVPHLSGSLPSRTIDL
ncbi:uncharacterized protein LOC142242401 [Haematobia irritans]|uniref:uncharacterized protein LOC142242401 n=1 Tax=Haematobia irritans TaxID=7368 RepID=UPI003F4F97FF